MSALLLVLACGGAPAPAPEAPPPPPPPPPAPAGPAAPTVSLQAPAETRTTPIALTLDAPLQTARDSLAAVVTAHAFDPTNPWAIVHGMLALGADHKLANGQDPVDWLFAEYAEPHTVGGEELVQFPASHGKVRIEPHTDLVLKALTEGGVPPTRRVTLKGGREIEVSALWRDSLVAAWVDGRQTGFVQGWNDTPWALQAFATWSPGDLEWTAAGGHPMSLDRFTDGVVSTLERETASLAAAQKAGQTPKKDGTGVYQYTCGGAHLLMGATYAVGRGFGGPDDAKKVCAAKDVWRFRVDVELGSLDPILADPKVDKLTRTLVLTQRMKFLGHWLEATAKIFALGVCEATEEDRAATLRVATELATTVDALDKLGAFAAMPTMRTDPAWVGVPRGAEQLYLDLVGDAAHAVRGLDLATGAAGIAR